MNPSRAEPVQEDRERTSASAAALSCLVVLSAFLGACPASGLEGTGLESWQLRPAEEERLLEALAAFGRSTPRRSPWSFGGSLALGLNSARGAELSSSGALSELNRYASGFVRLYGGYERGRHTAWVMMDSGELRSAQSFATDLVEDEGLLSSGFGLGQEVARSGFVREFAFRRKGAEGAWTLGRIRTRFGRGLILDDYVAGAHATWSNEDWQGHASVGTTSELGELDTASAVALAELKGRYAGCSVGGLFDPQGQWGENLLSPSTNEVEDIAIYSFRRARVFNAGCHIDLSFGEFALRGSAVRAGGELVGGDPYLAEQLVPDGTPAEQRDSYNALPERLQGAYDLVRDQTFKLEGWALHAEAAYREQEAGAIFGSLFAFTGARNTALRDGQVSAYLGLSPLVSATTLFFANGWQHAVGYGNTVSFGIDGAGVSGLSMRYRHRFPRAEISARATHLRVPLGSGSLFDAGTYGNEFDLRVRWEPPFGGYLDAEAGLLRKGSYFSADTGDGTEGDWVHIATLWLGFDWG